MGKWESVQLGDICNILNGFAFESKYYAKCGHRVIRITNVQKGKIVDNDPKFFAEEKGLAKFELQSNDLLMSLTGNVGRVGLIQDSLLPAYLNQRVACLRTKENTISKWYLYSFLNSEKFENDAINSSKGLAQKNMSTEWLKEYKIPLPPLPIQQKIADALDKASALIEMRKAQIEKLDLLIKSQFIEMFGDPVTNPKGWKTVQIKEVFNIRSSKRVFQSELTSNGVPFLRVSDLVRKIENKDGNSDLYISESKFKSLLKDGFVPKKNDVLITTRGTLGKCYIIKADDRFYFQDGMISWLESTRVPVSTLYISYLFQTDYIVNQIKEVSKGATVDFLSLNKLGSLHALFPNINVQTKFASFVESIEKRKSELQVSLIELENCNKALMQKCFSGEMF